LRSVCFYDVQQVNLTEPFIRAVRTEEEQGHGSTVRDSLLHELIIQKLLVRVLF